MGKVVDILGKRFSRLTVIKHVGRTSSKSRSHLWLVKCDCGTEFETSGAYLRSGETKSCGCLQRAIAKAAGDRTRTHGMAGTSIYNLWRSMVKRCSDQRAKDYKSYGGRGITVCDRWLDFENFLADMGSRPEGMSLDRIDNNKGYYKENCRWSTSYEQSRNKRTNRIIKYNGEELPLVDWAKKAGIEYQTLRARLRKGMSFQDAIETPVASRARMVKRSLP